MKTDSDIQAQVDAQLLEQGTFSPLELLFSAGRLDYGDYESWRRGHLESLDGVLMGSPEKIKAQLEAAAAYASSIGLVEEAQEFHGWQSFAGERSASDKPLTASADPQLARRIASIFKPARSAPQMDLFFDNPVVALTNGIANALAARNPAEAQRHLDRLYARAPNHADLAAFDRLVDALGHLDCAIEDPRRELDFLLQVAPTAKRLLGSRARDLLTPLWRQLADALEGRPFSADEPALHRSFALSQAQQWPAVAECVLAEPGWWMHAPLCLRLAQSGFYRQHRADSLRGWFQLCWRSPDVAADVLDKQAQPDQALAALWEKFTDSDAGGVLSPPDFPAWMLLNEPGLVQLLPLDLPSGHSAGENHYRCVHRLIHARRTGRRDEEMAQRKVLMLGHPLLFQWLKSSI